jgi:hypothetical protein
LLFDLASQLPPTWLLLELLEGPPLHLNWRVLASLEELLDRSRQPVQFASLTHSAACHPLNLIRNSRRFAEPRTPVISSAWYSTPVSAGDVWAGMHSDVEEYAAACPNWRAKGIQSAGHE